MSRAAVARCPTWPELGELSRDVLETLRLASVEPEPAVAFLLAMRAEALQRRVDDGLRRLIAAGVSPYADGTP